jgi:flavin reductase (DIM6/NTAB) family NADH-FMN oxidoreductase RutF
MEINPADLNKRDIHELLVSAFIPRPIAFVSTIGEDGVFNVAPFSFFTPLCLKPTIVGLSISWKREGQKKDTLRNIEFSKDFVVNVVNEALAEAMNIAAAEYPSDVDEFKEVGLTPVKASQVKAPMVAESPVNMECKLIQIIEFGQVPTGGHLVMGEVVRAHVRDELWAGDHIEVSKLKAIGRLGGDLYCRTTDIFEMKRVSITSML